MTLEPPGSGTLLSSLPIAQGILSWVKEMRDWSAGAGPHSSPPGWPCTTASASPGTGLVAFTSMALARPHVPAGLW